ncbi:LysR family transcriptional regulator [Speluncibacter jeojiensis]|uniref:LysR substrate-binding domain-containing protein n=1 Tax=Speluncibacter jeojiensis TaxID=2710754 RepID=A0A9X4LXQ6_9ACTN|nr:LysR substrate-binding domain-containing protein [Corynebacteriales bacterium D3-21]
MELRHLRYFTAVAEELHFGRAAARLYVTQSTLSVQIQQLEAEIGGALLARSSRQVQLTEAGRLLYAEACRTLDQADRALYVTRQSVLGEIGSIRIGFAGVAAFSGVLPADLRTFHRAHPDVEIEIGEELPPSGVVDELRSGAIDLGYTHDMESISPDEFTRTFRKRIELTAALPASHRLCAKDALSKADLDTETLIVPATDPGIASIAERIRPIAPGGSAGVRLVPTTLGVLTLAAAGMGVAIVPEDTSLIALGDLVYRPIADVTGPDMVVLHRRGETFGPVLAFSAAIR